MSEHSYIMKVISQFASSIKLFEIDQPVCVQQIFLSHMCVILFLVRLLILK